MVWYLHALGLAHYRAGQFVEAIQRLEESNTGNWVDEGKMQNRLVLAMAHHRLGHTAQSRALLDEVERWWQTVEAAKTDGAVAFSATDWLPLQLLRREAEAVILYDPVFPADPFAQLSLRVDCEELESGRFLEEPIVEFRQLDVGSVDEHDCPHAVRRPERHVRPNARIAAVVEPVRLAGMLRLSPSIALDAAASHFGG